MARTISQRMPGSYRITWVDADGTVLFDNRQDPEEMGEPRPAGGDPGGADPGEGTCGPLFGHAFPSRRCMRPSGLPTERCCGCPAPSIPSGSWYCRRAAAGGADDAAGLHPGHGAGFRVARQLVEPINAIDLNSPAGSETYEELTPLLSKLRSQQRQIQRQMRDLKRRQEEFTAITENMSEGFLVIDQETRVLTYNSCRVAAALRAGPHRGGRASTP